MQREPSDRGKIEWQVTHRAEVGQSLLCKGKARIGLGSYQNGMGGIATMQALNQRESGLHLTQAGGMDPDAGL